MIKYDKWILGLLSNLKNHIQESIYSKTEIDKLLKDLDIDINNVLTEEDIQKIKDIKVGTNEDGKFFIINGIKIQIKTINGEDHIFINDKDISSQSANISEMNEEEINSFINTVINS